MRGFSHPAKLLALALLAGAGLTACAPVPATPCGMAPSLNLAAGASMAGVPDDVRPLNSVGRQGVRMTDDSLLSMVLVEDVQTGRLPSGSAEIAVRLTNCTATPLQVEGATQFLGPTGAQTEPPTVWQRIFLPPRTSRVYQATSTGPRTAAMAVDLREGR